MSPWGSIKAARPCRPELTDAPAAPELAHVLPATQVRLSHTLAATPAAKPHDAFDRDDFDAIQYINEMFPNGGRSFHGTV